MENLDFGISWKFQCFPTKVTTVTTVSRCLASAKTQKVALCQQTDSQDRSARFSCAAVPIQCHVWTRHGLGVRPTVCLEQALQPGQCPPTSEDLRNTSLPPLPAFACGTFVDCAASVAPVPHLHNKHCSRKNEIEIFQKVPICSS